MTNTFLISDTHFGHEKMWSEFKRDNGDPVRPFKSTEEMDETMIDNWNKVVGEKDVVYHLGDVVINRKFLHLLYRLNGRKKLVRGNHDVFKMKDYLPHFEDIYGTIKLADYILTHVPIHPESIPKWCAANVHGHTHYQRVMVGPHGRIRDERYICVSVEHTGYAPVSLEEVKKLR